MDNPTIKRSFFGNAPGPGAALLAVLLVSTLFAVRAAESPASSKTNLMDLTLEQLMEIKVDSVTGASGYEQKVSLAPSAVTVITDDEIKKYGHRTLAEVLRSARGFYATSDRNYTYLGLRGFDRPGDYNSRFLLLVNGHRLNDNVYDSAFVANEFPLDLDLVDRVEIIRGPSSSIYGNNAFFGVINVVTKQGRDLTGVEASGAVGSFGSYLGRFTVGKKYSDEVEVLLSGSLYDSAGPERLFFPEFNTPAQNNGIATKADYEHFFNLFGSLRLGDFTLEASFHDRRKGIPTASFGTVFGDRRANTVDRPAYVDLKFERNVAADWELTARAYFDSYRYVGEYPYAAVLNKDQSTGSRVGVDTQLTGKILDRHTLTFGVELRDNLQQDQFNCDLPTGTINLNEQRDSYNAGVFGQAEISLLTNLTFNAGLRFDHQSQSLDRVNPRLGLIYAPVEATTMKLLYGTAFRAPNVFEQYYSYPGSAKANPGLRPEKIATYEVVAEQKLPAGLQFSASGYYYHINDLINAWLDSTGQTVYRNLSKVDTHGVELELQGHWAGGLRGRASYAFQETADSMSRRLSNSPKHLAKFNIIAPLWRDKVFSGLELQYQGRVRTLTGNTTGAFWLANLTIFSREVVKGVELSAGLYNLFDTRYGQPGASEHLQDVIQQDGRTFRVKLTYRF